MFEQDIRLGPGTGTTTSHTLEILIMLAVAALLGLWLGWILWSRYQQEAEKLRLDNASLQASTDTLRAELTAAKAHLVTADADNTNLSAQVASLHRNNGNLRDRIAELEESLAATEARNRTVETELGLSYAPDTQNSHEIALEISTPSNTESLVVTDSEGEDLEEDVPTIAPFPTRDSEAEDVSQETSVPAVPDAAEEHILEIPARQPVAQITFETPAAITPEEPPVVVVPPAKGRKRPASAGTEAPPAPLAALDERDDLTVVEGIGPKIQMLLNQYGIHTYHQLASTDVDRIKEILSSAGPQLAMHDPGTWPSQANLAANDQWEALKSIQGFLKGGKKPT